MAQSNLVIFVEVVALIGVVAFFSSQHQSHLQALSDKLETIEKSVKASEAALERLQKQKEAIVNARVETDKKLLEVPDSDECYKYYDRVLCEDAERRAAGSASGADVPVR